MKPKTVAIPLLALACLFSVVQSTEAGKLRRLIYQNYTGSWITNLYTTNSFGIQTFPDTPDAADFLPNGTPGFVFPPYNAETVINTAAPDNYGSWIRGTLTAPETGDYIFWLATDDEGQFYMTTDAADPLNPSKTNLLCWVPGWSGSREWTKFPQQQSAPVTLEKGKTYYLEIFHKEGTGGDHIVLGWQTPSGLLQRPMPAWHFQPFRDTRWSEPDTELVLGPIIPRAAYDYNLYDGNEAVAYVNVNLDPPITYQWVWNGTDIPGATQGYYIFRPSMSDNNASLSVRVNGVTVGPSAVYVTSDKPTLVSAGPVPQNPTIIRVVFSEDVSAATATNIANYSIPGATVQWATLATDNRTVTVKTTLLTPTQVYTLSVSGVQDMAVPPNTMDSASVSFVIADGAINYRVYNNRFATDFATLRSATTNSASANSVYTNNQFSSETLATQTTFGWNLIPLRDNYAGQMIGYVTPPTNGQYKFAIASDDNGILYLGYNDQRSSKREICSVNGYTDHWNLGKYTSQQSALITLEAGKRYYIEAVQIDGTGGDGLAVFWQTPFDVINGTLFPTANANNQAAAEPFYIPARYLSPFTAFGELFFRTNLPATLTAAAGTQPVLRVTVDGTLPYNYQWFRNGIAIAGATGPALTGVFLQESDDGVTFSVTVTNNFSSTNSIATVVTVTSDTVPPTVATLGSLFKQLLDVRFSEPVTPATAGDPANYLLFSSADTPVAVTNVVLDGGDATHVTLQTAPMPETDLMKLVVQKVADQSPAGNVIALATNVCRANNFEAAVPINNSQAWSAAALGEQLFLTAGGSDIWGTGDNCLFLYKTVTGNFDYKVQGVSLPAVNSWCKMGPMARASTAAGSRNVFNPFTPVTPGQNTYSAQVRDTTGGGSLSSNDAGQLNSNVQVGVPARPTINPYPSWTRIQRIGNTFYYYYSANGTNWTYWTYYDSTLSTEGALPATLLVGLALTSHDNTRTVDGVMNQFIAVNDGPLRFALEPTNSTCVEGGTVVLRALAAGNSPYYYQWLTNGTAMTTPDVTNANLTLTRVPFTYNNLQFACRVTNPYGETVTSSNATLTVAQDTVAPTVRYYVLPKINRNPTEVKLLFSEPMERNSAQALGNYQITASAFGTNLAISSALLELDDRTVSLITAPQTPGTLYRVAVNNVTDQACCPPNAIAPNSTDYFYYAGSSGNFAQRSDGYIIMEAEDAQLNEAGTSGGSRTFSQLTTSAGYSGLGYMSVPNGAGTGGTAGTSPQLYGTGAKLSFNIVFNRTGRHIVWLRGWNENPASAGNDDSVYIGFNDAGTDPASDWFVGMTSDVNQSQLSGWSGSAWSWRSDRNAGSDPLTFTNTTTGLHKFIIWQREDGTLIDKIVIESGLRAAGNTAAPAPATANGGLGEPESWDWVVPPPAAPTISIVNPANNQVFAAASNIPIEASVTGSTPVALVEFFSGANLIGTATASPYTMTWGSVPEGIYSVTARVTDVLGYQATSAAVPFAVDSTKPVAYAVGSLGGNSIGVYFADLTGLDAVSANNPANYLVNGGAIAVTNAALELDNLAVMLSLDAPISGNFSVQITNVADRGFGPNVMEATTLSSKVVTWPLHQDVGTTNASGIFTDPVMPGLAQAIGTDGFYVRAGGSDIWNNADGMHFVYQLVTNNFDVTVRVASLLRPDVWSKAGIMIREDLSGGSRNHMILAAPTNGQNVLSMQWRPVAGAGCSSISSGRPASPIPNAWLRVTGTNSVYSFMWGTNGTDWTTWYTTNLSATPYSQVYVGVATTSHNNGATQANVTAAYYRDVSGLAPAAVMQPPMLSVQYQDSTLTLSWPAENIGMRLESQFCPPGTGIGSNWGTVPNSTTTNRVIIPIELNQGSMFFRLVYP